MNIAISDRIKSPCVEEKIIGKKILTTPNPNTEILFVWHQVIDSEYIDKLPRLKYIIRYGVGFDKVDVEYARSKGILVSNTPDYCTDEVSDTTIAFITASTRRIIDYNHMAKSYTKGWQENVDKSIRRNSETLIGFIGAGRIGQSSMLKAKSLGFQIQFFDPYQVTGLEKILGVKRVDSLDQILSTSDVISIHTPLTNETKGMINSDFIDKMKNQAILINTARGGIMEDADILYEPLRSGRIKSAFLDVLPQEPFSQGKLFKAWKNNEDWIQHALIINPHAAFYSKEASIEMRVKVANNAKRFINGESPHNLL